MKCETLQNQKILYPQGDIDIITAERFRDESLECMDGATNVAFDCKDVDFIDSTGLGVFVALNKQLRAAGGTLTLLHLKPTIKKLFTITKLNEVMTLGE